MVILGVLTRAGRYPYKMTEGSEDFNNYLAFNSWLILFPILEPASVER